MHGQLVDIEGFPRSDIDIQQVRYARQQITCLQNDRNALMKRIEELLHHLHAEAMVEELPSLSSKSSGIQKGQDSGDLAGTPSSIFAEVTLVSHGSPAEEAGIRVGDQIIEFGSVTSKNFTGDLNQIASVVNHIQNQRIPLKIQRHTQVLFIGLTPKPWKGRGLLGCNIILSHAKKDV